MNVPFTKMHALGNDFIIFENIDIQKYVTFLCDRHVGIGADGVIVIDNNKKYTYYNSADAQTQMCGNGLRCFMKYIFDKQLIAENQIFTINSDFGDRQGKVINVIDNKNAIVEMEMGQAKNVKKVDFEGLECFLVNYGNEHFVCYTDKEMDICEFGKKVQMEYKLCNVEIVKEVGANSLRMKVYENGVGETKACATGACASAYIGLITKRSGNQVEVIMDGGKVQIQVNEQNTYLTGQATRVYEGIIQLSLLEQ